jgi:hypothetical protein
MAQVVQHLLTNHKALGFGNPSTTKKKKEKKRKMVLTYVVQNSKESIAWDQGRKYEKGWGRLTSMIFRGAG